MLLGGSGIIKQQGETVSHNEWHYLSIYGPEIRSKEKGAAFFPASHGGYCLFCWSHGPVMLPGRFLWIFKNLLDFQLSVGVAEASSTADWAAPRLPASFSYTQLLWDYLDYIVNVIQINPLCNICSICSVSVENPYQYRSQVSF